MLPVAVLLLRMGSTDPVRSTRPGSLPQTLTLGNGLRVRYRRFPGHPVVHIYVAVRAGAADDASDKLGLSYVLAKFLSRRAGGPSPSVCASHPCDVGGRGFAHSGTFVTDLIVTVPTTNYESVLNWIAQAIFAPPEMSTDAARPHQGASPTVSTV